MIIDKSHRIWVKIVSIARTFINLPAGNFQYLDLSIWYQ